MGGVVMKKSLLLGVALAALLFGCAPMIWVKPGSTEQDFNKDQYECEKDVRQSGYYGTGISRDIEMQNFFTKCMVSKGWSRREASQGRNNTSGNSPYVVEKQNR